MSKIVPPPDDAFGIVWWTDEDIKQVLQAEGKAATPAAIEAVRNSREVRTLACNMIRLGWKSLHEAAARV